MTLSKPSKTLLTLALSSSLFFSFSQNSVHAESNLVHVDTEITPFACPEAGTYTTVYNNKTTWKQTLHIWLLILVLRLTRFLDSVSISHQATVSIGGEYEYGWSKNYSKRWIWI